MSDECLNALHSHPLPRAYLAAHEMAEDRLAANWKNLKCPDCKLYGWEPPAANPAS
jgi:hypothetical protein